MTMLSEKELWQNTLVHLEMNTSSTGFKTWFKDTVLLKNSEGEVYIGVPNRIAKDWLQDKHHKLILKTLRSFDDNIRSINFQVSKDAGRSVPQNNKAQCEVPSQQLPMQNFFINKQDNLNPKYTFDTFVVGSFNQIAHAASQAVIKNPALTYNPLFIYGSTGYGKTHLIQSVGNYLKKANSSSKVLYVSAEKFSVDYINAVRAGKANAFKDKYRQYDVLIMDDVQFIAKTEKTQEELFHLFNALHDNNKQIIFSSDKHPNYMPGLEDRLRGRFSAGIIAEITEPEVESREVILKEKASQRNINIPNKVISYIANEVPSNIRELEGILNAIICKIQLKGKDLTEQEVKTIIKHSTKPNQKVSTEDIVSKVADYYNIDEESIYKKTRKKEVVRPRQIVMYILREDFHISFPTIGEKLGGRDHTTVIHSCEKIKQSIIKDATLDSELERIRSLIHG